MSRFQFVADHRHTFEVKRLCEIVQVARSSFYAWQDAAPRRAAQAGADAELADRIRTIHDQDRTQGVPRITAELNDGVAPEQRVNHKRIARVMRAHAIAGLRLRRRVRTTIPEPAEQQVPDLLRRDFTATAVNQRYVGDITYLPIADGSNLYLATVIDCFSRRLAGWAIAEHMRTDLVMQVVGVPDTRYGEEVMAWIVLRPDAAELTVDDVRTFATGRLAHYKIPRYVRIVEEFPMTVSGKVRKVEMRRVSIELLGLGDVAAARYA